MRHAMKNCVLAATFAAGTLALAQQSHAVACANGGYRAGCVGPNGAAVVRKPAPVYRAKPSVSCANGVYRAGCVGPNGAAVVRKPY
jgi:hypothetical protein